MPKVKKSGKTCVICLETIKNRKRKEAGMLAAGLELAHGHCIRKWSKIDNRCPQCKRHFNWIIHRNKKEKVVKQKHVNIIQNFMVELIHFLYNNDFRYTTTAIMRAQYNGTCVV